MVIILQLSFVSIIHTALYGKAGKDKKINKTFSVPKDSTTYRVGAEEKEMLSKVSYKSDQPHGAKENSVCLFWNFISRCQGCHFPCDLRLDGYIDWEGVTF